MGNPGDEPILAREQEFLDGLVELMGCLDLRTALQKVADLGHLVIGARTCTVREFDTGSRVLILRGARGATEQDHLTKWRSLGCTESVVGQVYRTGKAYETLDIQSDPFYEMKEFAARNDLLALRSEPILDKGRFAGVVTLYFADPGDLTAERRMLCCMLARFAAQVTALHRSRDANALPRPAPVLPVTASVAQSIDAAAGVIADRALEISGRLASAVMIPQGGIGDLEVAAIAGWADLLEHPDIAPLCQRAFAQRAARDRVLEPRTRLLFPARHAAAFPCAAAEQCVGVLTVAGPETRALDAQASEGLGHLAARAAEVILQLQARDRIEAVEELLTTLGISRQEGREPDAIRAYLLDFARTRLGAEGAVLYLWDARSSRYTPRSAKGFKNIRRPIDYARGGYALGEAFVGQVAQGNEVQILDSPDRDVVDADPCLKLLRQQTHSRDLSLCIGVPLQAEGAPNCGQPFGVVVFADGREGAALPESLEGLGGGALLSLAAQVSAIVRTQEILEREDRLLRVATHQAKNPLARIVQIADAIRRHGVRADYLDQLSLSAREALRNMEQILHVQRAVSERGAEPEELDLSAAVRTALARYEVTAEERGCALTRCIASGCRVIGDSAHVRGLLDNLIDNAIRYAPKDDGAVAVGLRAVDAYLLLTVSDNGPGLPDDARQSLRTGAVQRVRPDGDLRRGFGLGLFIVTAYADALGWQMSVEDRIPRGTLFTFTIPIPDRDHAP